MSQWQNKTQLYLLVYFQVGSVNYLVDALKYADNALAADICSICNQFSSYRSMLCSFKSNIFHLCVASQHNNLYEFGVTIYGSN